MINILTDQNNRVYAAIEIDKDNQFVSLNIKDSMVENEVMTSLRQLQLWAKRIGALTVAINTKEIGNFPKFLSIEEIEELFMKYNMAFISDNNSETEAIYKKLEKKKQNELLLTSQKVRARAWSKTLIA